MITLKQAHVAIQNVEVLRGFSLHTAPGSMVGLIGRKGAGKTTVMRTLMGQLPLLAGELMLGTHNLRHAVPYVRAELGVGYMPEKRGLVSELTVEENICVPLWVTRHPNVAERLRFVYQTLPELLPLKDHKALLLSVSQQKLVALARALGVGTQLLLLDGPFEGVAPALSQRLSEVLGQLRGSGVTVLISQSEPGPLRPWLDAEVVIEHGGNVPAA